MPYGGLFGIPSTSMRDALADMSAADRQNGRRPVTTSANITQSPIRLHSG